MSKPEDRKAPNRDAESYEGRRAKALYYRNKALGTVAVTPMILSEALAPSARRFFARRLRFPIADAHYAMGFAFRARAYRSSRNLRKAVVRDTTTGAGDTPSIGKPGPEPSGRARL